jgi:hypothetical protein
MLHFIISVPGSTNRCPGKPGAAHPAEHWDHLRTSNPIESVFATIRHRTVRTKGALSQDTARLMVFKMGWTAPASIDVPEWGS